MNEGFNPEKAPDSPLGSRRNALADALEELIRARSAAQANEMSGSRTNSKLSSSFQTEAVSGEMPDDCPGLDSWSSLLDEPDGLEGESRAGALLAHAAGCPQCAGRLRAFAADLSADEVELLDEVRSTSVLRQAELAARLAGTARVSKPIKLIPARTKLDRPKPDPAQRTGSRFYLWAGAGIAASLLIAVGMLSWWRLVNNPERLMAEAYAHDRLFELRIPGAAFADVTPPSHMRGGTAAREPAKLLEAKSRIERRLQATPEDPQMLRLQARADILEEKFDPAIERLDKLVAAGPVTAGLLMDDATAYFERGLATDSKNDRATALDSLRHADELAPDDPVVLFNEALVLEDQGQLMSAVETWNRYLRFERDPKWQAEGRQRLQVLEQKLNELRSQQRLKNQ